MSNDVTIHGYYWGLPWCYWHWASPESRTGYFCTAYQAEGHIPDCPFRTLAEAKASAHHCGDYMPVQTERTEGTEGR